MCTVWLTKGRQFIIDWRLDRYRKDNTVLKLIEDSKTRLMERYGAPARCARHSCLWNDRHTGGNGACVYAKCTGKPGADPYAGERCPGYMGT